MVNSNIDNSNIVNSKMDTQKLKLFSSSLLTGFILLLIGFNSITWNPTRFICKNYVFNIILFLALSISLLLTTVLSVDYFNLYEIPQNYIWIIIISIFILLFTIIITPSNNPLLKISLYTIYFVLSGLIFSKYYKDDTENFNFSFMIALALLLSLSIFSYFNPNFIPPFLYKIMFISLSGLVLLYFINIIRKYQNGKGFIDKELRSQLAIFGVGLFILFIIYDMNTIYLNASKCNNKIVDYTKESLNISLDFLNLFSNLLRLKSD